MQIRLESNDMIENFNKTVYTSSYYYLHTVDGIKRLQKKCMYQRSIRFFFFLNQSCHGRQLLNITPSGYLNEFQ